jgi:uridine kinase
VFDIEAARQTGSLAIGTLYGYGGQEPEQADMVISRFSHLLGIFDRRKFIFQEIDQRVRSYKVNSRPFVVGITGIDLAGKTEFTNALANYLTSLGREVAVIHLDDFHNSRAYRYGGADPVENYWLRSFNLELLVREVLIPVHEKQRHSVTLTLLDLSTDKGEVQKEYTFTRETIVVIEGVFLFRQELAPYIEYKMYLEIPFEESRRRALVRDVPTYGVEIMKRYEEKYWPAQRRYLAEYPPPETADLIIDNTNWECPRVAFDKNELKRIE